MYSTLSECSLHVKLHVCIVHGASTCMLTSASNPSYVCFVAKYFPSYLSSNCIIVMSNKDTSVCLFNRKKTIIMNVLFVTVASFLQVYGVYYERHCMYDSIMIAH